MIGETAIKKFGITLKVALLNQSGDKLSDQSWIEYNDLLCPDEYKSNFCGLLCDYLSKQGFDLFYASMLYEVDAARYAELPTLSSESLFIKGYKTALFQNKVKFSLERLSKNTRSQVRRSNKKLEQLFGEIKVVLPCNKKEELSFFETLSKFHIEQWGTSYEGSGFSNIPFLQHQKGLLTKTEVAHLIGVFAGDVPLGYCINYLYNKDVLFYCSGINHAIASSHVKPGYSMHIALMEHYAREGFETYDFLGGESRYKASLSDQEYYFLSLTFPLNSLKGRLYAIYKRFFTKTC